MYHTPSLLIKRIHKKEKHLSTSVMVANIKDTMSPGKHLFLYKFISKSDYKKGEGGE
jgi:hypothetical protein